VIEMDLDESAEDYVLRPGSSGSAPAG